MKLRHAAVSAALSVICAGAFPALAEVAVQTAPATAITTTVKAKLAYTNLGYGGAFSTTNYYFVSGPTNHAYTYAAPFVAGASGQLNHIDLPLQSGAVVVSIYADANGAPATYDNGPPLEEWLADKIPNTLTPGKSIKFVSKSHPTLAAGKKYWIVVAPLFYDSITAWYHNIIGSNGVDGSFQGGWANSWMPYTANAGVAPAFDIWIQ